MSLRLSVSVREYILVSLNISLFLPLSFSLSLSHTGNLEDELQKHETLVAEINANKKRLDDLESRGQELVNEDHYAAPEIAGE